MMSIFVAGGTGFIGRRFVAAARSSGLDLHVLTRSPSAAERLAGEGVRPVLGDLMTPGPWGEAAASSDFAVYVAGPPTWGRRLTKNLAHQYQDGMLAMTDAFCRSLDASRVERVVYVAGASYYGDTGSTAAVEDQQPVPTGTGPYIAPAIDLVREYGGRGLPTVVTFPGAVYGPGSWLSQLILEPLHRRKMIPSVRGSDPAISVVHVDDCARALLHLLHHGRSREQYFIADDEPVTLTDIAALASGLTGIQPKLRAFPRWLSKLVIGPILTDAATGNVVVSNEKLKRTGFTLTHPSMREGLPAVIAEWSAQRQAV